MGCGPSMPKLEGFHVEQTVPASGFMLGDVASTADSQVVLRFPCGMSLARSSFDGPEPPSTCQVLDGNQTLLFTVHRAGAEPKSSMLSTIKPLRKPTIVRDPTGQVIAVLQTDAAEPRRSTRQARTATPATRRGYGSRGRRRTSPSRASRCTHGSSSGMPTMSIIPSSTLLVPPAWRSPMHTITTYSATRSCRRGSSRPPPRPRRVSPLVQRSVGPPSPAPAT